MPTETSHEKEKKFLMYRMELKDPEEWQDWPMANTFLMYRMELKEGFFASSSLSATGS